jgi:hypothetical protein
VLHGTFGSDESLVHSLSSFGNLLTHIFLGNEFGLLWSLDIPVFWVDSAVLEVIDGGI